MHLIALLMTFATMPALAATPSCPPYSAAISLDFQVPIPEVRVDNTLSIAAIRELAHGRTPISARFGVDLLGLTATTPLLDLKSHALFNFRKENVCIYLENVQARFGFREIEVYIASEYPPGTCAYRAILDHENQHVAISQAALKEHADQMRAELERQLPDVAPLSTHDSYGAANDILDQLYRSLEPIMKEFHKDSDARNQAIDSQENYDAIAASCKDWPRDRSRKRSG